MGSSLNELKDLGGWKSRIMVNRYAKYATEHLHAAASRIEEGRGGNVLLLSRSEIKKGLRFHVTLYVFWLPDLDSNQGPAD